MITEVIVLGIFIGISSEIWVMLVSRGHIFSNWRERYADYVMSKQSESAQTWYSQLKTDYEDGYEYVDEIKEMKTSMGLDRLVTKYSKNYKLFTCPYCVAIRISVIVGAGWAIGAIVGGDISAMVMGAWMPCASYATIKIME